MGCILTCCIDSSCGWCKGEEEPCYESDTYEAVAAATSESTTVEPGKLDVGATEGHDLQHISNQKMPTGPPEDSLSLKSLPPSEEDNDDAQILPSRVQGSSEDNLSLLSLPRSEDDYLDDDDDAQILPSPVQGSSEDNLSLLSLPRSEDDYLDDDDDAQILPSPVQGSSEDNLSLVSLPRSEDDYLDDDDDAQILPSPVQARPEDDLFLRCSPQHKDEDDNDDGDVQITAWNENDLTLESISDEETYPEAPPSLADEFLHL
ncbi:aspartate-rich protein 1-like isoform X3 [Macaca nemestrina]|uniref:aspartate-rich protein 1-like isoform X3 n=1 Tax=Macaca nemestrina TaxID=9545 RepID=UPI0039B8479E